MNDMQRLSNKVALVFGGGSAGGEINNGLATSIVYAQAGAHVVIVDVNEEAVKSGVARLTAECDTLGIPFEGTGLVGDVTSEESVSGVVDQVIARYGRIDILHNNVGIARMGGPIEMSLDEWEFVMRINLTSAFLTCKFVLPHMLEQGSGSIVNVSSIGGMRYIGYNYPSYSATKGGMIQFTTNIALQYARQGIRANCVAPGYIESPLMYRQISGNYDSVEEMVAARNELSPTGKMGDCFDVAYASLFLASDEAKYVNGVCLPVDGGLTQQSAAAV
ncbi:SDR family NAD(P)-dependent oxidoreductase [Salinibacterium sp. NK8237]|uniref:SDR family NAD(P)-dependent oxidoreductase n=1 Tax=Salinibacterium sp. NK8237 TaxID=2792038 RepID=UPI0018CCD918|nr:SDR family NAD(P)-dependent oxidoreductase [Salinibacterium sp. NK8237]